MVWKNVYFVLHAPDSGKIIREFLRIVIEGFNMDNLVLSRVMGSATNGIEQASKRCFKLEKNLLIVKDIHDAIEMLEPEKVILFPPPKFSKDEVNFAELADVIKDGKKLMIVFGAGKVSGLTRKDLEKGDAVKVTGRDIGPLGVAAILVHELQKIA
ncbi:MAG: RecB-family nuclease [Promethearchaeota archaeon]